MMQPGPVPAMAEVEETSTPQGLAAFTFMTADPCVLALGLVGRCRHFRQSTFYNMRAR